MTTRIRLATVADVPALAALIPLAVRRLSHDCYTSQQIESFIAHAAGIDSQLIADGTFFAAEIDGHLVGCGGWSRRQKIFGGDNVSSTTDDVLDPATDAARIRAFFVHPDFARRGIGADILEHCARAAREAGFHRLELLGTLPGQKLYQACGFGVEEYVDHVLPDGVTIRWVKMGRDLT